MRGIELSDASEPSQGKPREALQGCRQGCRRSQPQGGSASPASRAKEAAMPFSSATGPMKELCSCCGRLTRMGALAKAGRGIVTLRGGAANHSARPQRLVPSLMPPLNRNARAASRGRRCPGRHAGAAGAPSPRGRRRLDRAHDTDRLHCCTLLQNAPQAAVGGSSGARPPLQVTAQTQGWRWQRQWGCRCSVLGSRLRASASCGGESHTAGGCTLQQDNLGHPSSGHASKGKLITSRREDPPHQDSTGGPSPRAGQGAGICATVGEGPGLQPGQR